MPLALPESSDSRIIAHIDMDCFYVQVEQRKQPNLRGQPTAVVHYNSWKGGALLAVSYEARRYGVKRLMRGDEAKQVCPEIQLAHVPVARGKADLSTYRNAGSEVVSILARKGRCERASIDEVYLDLTDAAERMMTETPTEGLKGIDEAVLKSHVLGLDGDGSDSKGIVREWFSRSDADYRDKLLACGAIIVAELRLQVLRETEFTCSAGIAHNKMLAKLASGLNKPAQQTVVPYSAVKGLLEPLPIKKMKQLGGKLGSSLQSDLGVNTMGGLLHFSEEKLQELYGINTGSWLWHIARGISGEEVEGRLLPKSHGSGKTFPGPRPLKTIASVEHWLNVLCEELNERLHFDLEKNKRIAQTLTLHATACKFNDSDSYKNFPSKSCPLRYGTSKIQEDALKLFRAALREYLGSHRTKSPGNQYNGWGITGLSVSASKIFAIPSGTSSIMKYFHNHDQSNSSAMQLNDGFIPEDAPFSPSGSESYSGMHPAKPQIEFHDEETNLNQAEPCFDQEEDTREMCKDEGPSGYSSKPVQDRLIQETSLLSAPEAESYLLQNQTDLQAEFQREKTGIKHAMHGVRSQEKKRKMSKEKGTCSILQFFRAGESYSAMEQKYVKTVQEVEASSSGGLHQKSLLAKTNVDTYSSGQNESTKNAWTYKIDEIDPAVVNELPLDMQAEVRAWLRPHKLANTTRRGSGIAHYFPPTKN